MGILQRRGANPFGSAPIYDFANFFEELREIEKLLVSRELSLDLSMLNSKMAQQCEVNWGTHTFSMSVLIDHHPF